MTAPIDIQLRKYTEAFEGALPEIEIEEVLSERVGTGPVQPLRPRRARHRQWLVAAAATFLVLLIVGGVGWLLRADPAADTPQPVDQLATTVPPPEEPPAAVRVPMATDDTYTWEVIGGEASQSFEPDTFISDLAYNGSVFVAVGNAAAGNWCNRWDSDPPACGGDFDPASVGAVWTSVDGIDWVRVPHDEAVFGSRGAWISDVAVWDGGFVAAGQHKGGVVWLSPDGFTWSRVWASDETFLTGEAWALATSDTTIVVIGARRNGGENLWAWSSNDGVTWTRSEIPVEFGLWDLAATDTGFIGIDLFGAVWTSDDGTSWEEDPGARLGGDTFDDDGFLVLALANGETGYIATGVRGDFSGRLWTSQDGRTWDVASHSYILGTEDQTDGVDAAATNSGFVVVGNNQDWASTTGPGARGRAAESAVWLSSDGKTWARAVSDDDDVFSAGYMTSVLVTDTRIVAAGHTISFSVPEGSLQKSGMIWVGTPREQQATP